MTRIAKTAIRLAAALAAPAPTPAADRPASNTPATRPAPGLDLPPPQGAPLVRGVLWFVRPEHDAPVLRDTLDAMAAVGMDTLWILGTNEFLTRPDNPLLDRLFAEADRRDWQVILATSGNDRWYVDWDLPALKRIEARNIPFLAHKYARHPSFFAWYINYEIYMEWDERCHRIRELYHCIGRLTREITPAAGLAVSPFFVADRDGLREPIRYADPEEYATFWAETIRHAGINLVMLQDSSELHCRCVPPETRAAFFEAMQAACRANHDAELWGNVETVEIPATDMADYARNAARYRDSTQPAPWVFDMTRNAVKLDLASRFCTRLVSWGWEFWNPARPQDRVGRSRDNYEAYRTYRQRVSRGNAP